MCHGCVSRALRSLEIRMALARLTQPWHIVSLGIGHADGMSLELYNARAWRPLSMPPVNLVKLCR
jgi:hypothetical protein